MQSTKVHWELSKRLLHLQYFPLTAKVVFEDWGDLAQELCDQKGNWALTKNDGDHLCAKKSLHTGYK